MILCIAREHLHRIDKSEREQVCQVLWCKETPKSDEGSCMHGNTGGIKDFRNGMGYRCIHFEFYMYAFEN